MNRTRLGSMGGGKEMWVGRRKRQEEGAGGWGSAGQESGEETGFLWGHQGPCGSCCSCLPSDHGPILPRGAQEAVCACGFPSLPVAQVDTGYRLTKETKILGRKVRELAFLLRMLECEEGTQRSPGTHWWGGAVVTQGRQGWG